MSQEDIKKQLERLEKRAIKKEFISEIVVELWKHIEDYRVNHRPDNCALEFTYDKLCATLFTYLEGYLDVSKINERGL